MYKTNRIIFSIIGLVWEILMLAQPTQNITVENGIDNKDENIKNFTGKIYFIPEYTNKLPDFSKLTPVGQIRTDCLNIPEQDYRVGFPGVTNRYEYFAINYTGQFYLQDSCIYKFLLSSDDGSKLYIDSILVIDNDYGHSTMSKTNFIKLGKCLHKIEVQYFQGPRDWVALQLLYKKIDEKKYRVFSFSDFYVDTQKKATENIEITIGNDILFDFDSYKLDPVSCKELMKIKSSVIDKNDIKKITITGYTDDIGTEKYNLELSLKRSQAVKDFLQKNGTDSSILIAKGCGEMLPKVANTNDANRKLNRRIEFTIEKQNKQPEIFQRIRDMISDKNLQKQVENLSNKDIGTRKFASQGERNAANYIREQFKQFGLCGKYNEIGDFFQKYTFIFDSLISFSIENKQHKSSYIKDFFTWEFCFLQPLAKVEIVYAGFGLDREDYSDYKYLSVKNKWVVVELNSPVDSSGKLKHNYDFNQPLAMSEINYKKGIAQKKGALGVIFRINQEKYKELFYRNKNEWYYYRSRELAAINRQIGTYPVIFIRQNCIDSLAGVDSKTYNSQIIAGLSRENTMPAIFKSTVTFKIRKAAKKFSSQNVIGLIKGKQDDVGLIISAHYDAAMLNKQSFYPGANDNASGTAAVIQLAEVFSKLLKAGYTPEKSIVFVAFSGEEEAMIGSGYFVTHNPFITTNKTLNINLDCIGTTDSIYKNNNWVTYIQAPQLEIEKLQSTLLSLASEQKSALNLIFNPNFDFSDNASFSYNGIRAIDLTTGWLNIHTPLDVPENLNYQNMKVITCFTYDLILDQVPFSKMKE